QVDTLFSDFQGGVSLDQLLSTSNSLQGQITSGGATTLVVTSIVNSATGVLAHNGADLNFIFSQTGTNSIQSMALIAPWVNWNTNVFRSMAFRDTNSFAAVPAAPTSGNFPSFTSKSNILQDSGFSSS